MFHRFWIRRAFMRYRGKTFTNDIDRLGELLLLYKKTQWIHTIYHPRDGRNITLPLWYMNAEALMLDLRAWHDCINAEDEEEINLQLKEVTYAILDRHTTLNRWLADDVGRVIKFEALLTDVIEYGRVLCAWLDNLQARDDLDARYGIRKTRKLARDCCELLTFALSRYTGVT